MDEQASIGPSRLTLWLNKYQFTCFSAALPVGVASPARWLASLEAKMQNENSNVEFLPDPAVEDVITLAACAGCSFCLLIARCYFFV